MSVRLTRMLAAFAVASLLHPSAAFAVIAFHDDFEGGTIGTNPVTPITGNPWVVVGTPGNNLIEANPLVNVDNGSAQVLRDERAGGAAGRLFIDLTAAQSAQLAAGDLLTIRFQHYQPIPDRSSIALAIYQNSDHNFTENAVDVEFLTGRAVKHYNDLPADFVDTGLVGTSGWDDVEVIVDYAADKWSISLNGGPAAANLPFRNNGDYTTAGSILIGPSVSQVTGFLDNVQVFVGAVPEPTGLATLLIGALAVPWIRRRAC